MEYDKTEPIAPVVYAKLVLLLALCINTAKAMTTRTTPVSAATITPKSIGFIPGNH